MTPKNTFQLKKPRPSSSRQSKVPSQDIFAQDPKETVSVPKGELDLFHYMVDHIADEVMLLDQEARIVFLNEAAVRALGYTRENILYRSETEFFKEKISILQWQKMYFRETKEKRGPISYIINRTVKGGGVRAVDITAVYMPYKGEEYMLAVGRDRTERLAFQAKLKESEDRYRLLSEQAVEGILMLSVKGVVLYANKAAAQIFKTSPDGLTGVHFSDLMDRASLSKAWECFKKVRSGLPTVCDDLNVKDKKGQTVSAEITASPIFRDNQLAQIHVILRDMSERRAVEALIRESEKMKALQDLIAGTTQEILQPLKGLSDRTQGLVNEYKDRHFEYIGYKEFNDLMKTLQTMNRQIKHCFNTTDRLLSFNRRKVKLVDSHCHANTVVRQIVDLLKHSLEVSDIKIKLQLSSKLPPIAIGSLDFHQVMNNIVSNAVQSLGNGGVVQIRTTYQKAENMVRVDCQDDGVGMPKEILDRVFEPFFTTKPRGLEKSSGLGLTVVYSILKTYRGKISIKSNLRHGTSVALLLPVYDPKKKVKSP
jgi:PAS domain S-box-containing protein